MVNRNGNCERDPQPRRAVIYTRVSCANYDSEKVMAAEIAAIQKYAEQNNIEIVNSYSDEDESGNDPDRPGLEGLLASASKPDPGFDTVLIRKWDRLARNRALYAAILEVLEASGIRVVATAEADNELTESLVPGVTAVLNDSLREQVSRNVKRGLASAASQGFYVEPTVPFGYRKIPVVDPTGRRCWKLEIVSESAETVQWVFERALEGASPKTIGMELNDSGIPAPVGGVWTHRVVYRILTNPIYHGSAFIDQCTGVPVEIRGVHPTIVCKEVFDRVQRLLKRIGVRIRSVLSVKA